jgi:hypothetical protein
MTISSSKTTAKTKLMANITTVADTDPGFFAVLTPGSGIRDKHPGSFFQELSKKFLD